MLLKGGFYHLAPAAHTHVTFYKHDHENQTNCFIGKATRLPEFR